MLPLYLLTSPELILNKSTKTKMIVSHYTLTNIKFKHKEKGSRCHLGTSIKLLFQVL